MESKLVKTCPFCDKKPKIIEPDIGPYVGFYKIAHRCKVINVYFESPWAQQNNPCDWLNDWNTRKGGKQ